MSTPAFDEQGNDWQTYAPFQLHNALNTKWNDVRLSFEDWAWLQQQYDADTIDGYYMNGYGVEGLVKAALFAEGLDPDREEIHYNSEGDCCLIHFKKLEHAARAAELAAAMIRSEA